MKRLTLCLALLCALLVGLLARDLVPEAHASGGSSWTCYRLHELPDVEDARDWSGSRKVAAMLNQVARHVPSGTVFSTKWDTGNADIVCVSR